MYITNSDRFEQLLSLKRNLKMEIRNNSDYNKKNSRIVEGNGLSQYG